MKKRRLMKMAVLAMLLAMSGSGAYAANTALTSDASVSDVYDHQLAAGNRASTAANYATVYGYMQLATGEYATALGSGSMSDDGNTYFNTASGSYSTTIGYGNTALIGRSTAVGYLNQASSEYATAIGAANMATMTYGTAVGYSASSAGQYATAVGNVTSASGMYSTAVGVGRGATMNSASGENSSAFGYMNAAAGTYGQAFGSGNTVGALAEGGVSMGSQNTVSGVNANAFGYNNQAISNQTMTVGAENYAIGVAATGIGYANQLTAANAMGLGVSNTASAEYAMAVGVGNSAVGKYAFALGAQNTSGAYSAVNKKITEYTTAIGYGNVTGGSVGDATDEGSENPGRTVALGYKNTTSVDDSVALGSQNVVANGTQSAAFGYQNIVNNSTEAKGIAVAFGGQNVVTSYDTTTPAAAFGYMNGYKEKKEGDTTENNGIVDGIAIGYYNQGEKQTAKDWADDTYKTKLGTTIYPVVIGSENTDNGIGTKNTGNGIGYANLVTAGYLTATGIGTQNTATSTKAIAVGYMNVAGSDAEKEDDRKQNYAAIGVLNVATGENSGAFGYRNYAGAKNTIAMGAGNNMASYDNSTYTAATTGEASVAIGYNNQAQTQNSTVFGYLNIAKVFDTRQGQTEKGAGQNSLLGAKNTGVGFDAVALGYGNTTGTGLASTQYQTSAAITYHTVAVGNANTATGVPGTSATNGNAIAVGYNNTASANYSKAFGVQNKVYGNNSTAFGDGNIIGTTGNDSYPSYNSYASALGVSNTMIRTYGSSGNIQNSTAVGVGNNVSYAYSIAAGYNNNIDYDYRNYSRYGNYNSLFGVGNYIKSGSSSSTTYSDDNNSLVGFDNYISSYNLDNNSLFGFANRATSDYGAALGKSNTVSYMDIALGNQNTLSTYSGTIGYKNSAYGVSGSTYNIYSYAIGGENTATEYNYNNTRTGSIVLGYNNYLKVYSYTNYLRSGSVKIGVGNNSQSYTNYSAVIGLNNTNNSEIRYLTQIGSGNKAAGGAVWNNYEEERGNYSTWLGQDNEYSYNTVVSHVKASVIGKDNRLGYYSRYTTVIGFANASNYLDYNTAIGTQNTVGGEYNDNDGNSYALAVGSQNYTGGSYASTFGYQNQIYYTSTSDGKYYGGTGSSLIGYRNNYGQSDYANASYGGGYYYGLGNDNKITIKYSTALGGENIVGQTSPSYDYMGADYPYNLAIGVSNQAGGTYIYIDGARANGNGYNRRSYNITTVGFENMVTGYTNLAYGYQNKVSGNQTMVSGYYRVDESAAIGQENIVKAGAAMSTSYTSNYYAGGYGSYALGHANTTQAPYSTVIGASNTVGGTRAYNKGATGNQHLNNTALGTGNTVGTSSYQDTYYATNYGNYTTAFNTFSTTGIGFNNNVGANYATAAGYGNTVINSTSNNTYMVTYSAALGQNNIIRAIGTSDTSSNDQRVMGGEYSYAIGYGNTTQFAGSTALGFSNTVGSSTAARSVLSGTNGYYNANTAIGTSNTVGGLFVTDKSDTTNVKTYQIYGATGIGVSNTVKGEEATAIGVSNTIEGSRTGHQNKNEANRSAAVGSRNYMYTTLDTIGTNEALEADVYNYALGNDNQLRGAGNLAVGNENNVGGTLNTQETADAANTALGGNNIVGGMYEDTTLGIKGNGRYNLAAGFGNRVIGQENTAIGIENYIEENSSNLTDSKNLTQHNTLVGVSNTVNYATYAGSRMYNVAVGEGNTMRNGYDTAIGFANLVGGAYASNVDNSDTPYHVALGSQNTVAGYGTNTDGATQNSIRQTAIGSQNTTHGRDSVVIGKSSVTGTEGEEEDTRESAAIGVRATAATMKSLAVGVDVTASEVAGTVAVGQNSTVTGEKASSFGVDNIVSGEESLAVGTGNDDVSGDRTIVIGSDNTSAVTEGGVTTGTNGSVIFGVENTVTGDYAVAFGGKNTAAGGAVAAGYHSSALGEHAVTMGYAQTVTKDGAHGTAVGSGYERTEGSPGAETTYYYGTEVSGVSGAAFGVANLVSGNYATAVGAGYYRHTEINQVGVDYFFQNTASGDYASAFGYLNSASGEHSLAAGTGYVETVDDVDTLYANTASGDRAAALGYANQALADESLAAGGYSKTAENATGATAIGEGYVATITTASGETTEHLYNEASGKGATALGFASVAAGDASTAAGSLSKTTGKNATAVGVGIIKETKDDSGHITAVEYIENIARGIGSTALGYANDAVSDSSTAIGALSKATGVGATAAGSGYTKDDGTLVYNEADGDGAVAFGYANIARGDNATALGSTITVDDTEWVNQALSEGSTAIGSGNTAGATDKNKATAIGVTNLATGNESLAIGVSNAAISDAAIFLGNRNVTTVTESGAVAKSGGQNATALGSDNQVAGDYAAAFGTSNVAYGDYDVVIGSEAVTGKAGAYRVAMGYQAQATGDKAIAIGYTAKATAENSIAFGANAQATFANSVAIGTDSVAKDSRSDLEKTLETTGYGTSSAAAGKTRTTHTVSFGDSTTTDNVTTGIVSRLTDIAEGRETKDASGWLIAGVGDTDAVNVKQLKKYINTVPVFYDHRDADATPFTAEGSYITTNDHWLSTDFWQENVEHGKDSTAYGYLANAKGETSSALGYESTTDTDAKDAIAMAGGSVTGEAGIAIGNGASAETGAAIGTGATATGASYAIGTGAKASGTNVMVLGKGNTSTGEEYTISVGNGTDNFRIVNLADAQIDKTAADYDETAAVNVETMKAILDTMPEQEAIVIFDDGLHGRGKWRDTGDHWVATDFDLTGITHGKDSTGYGYATQASGQNSTAIGYGYTYNNTLYYNQATANYASAFGTGNTASGLYALAAGLDNTASAEKSSAVGYDNTASGANSTAIGYSTQAQGDNSTAIGNNAIAYSQDSIAIGTAYSDTTSGTMQAQAYGTGATAIGMGALASGDRALSIGAYTNNAYGADAVAIGSNNYIYGDQAGAFGLSNYIGTYTTTSASPAAKSYALGYYNSVSGEESTAMGYRNTVTGAKATAVGLASAVVADRGFAAGYASSVGGADAVAAGYYATAFGASSTALGYLAYATAQNSAAIGYESVATDSRVADDGTDAKINTVSFGHKETDIDPTTITQENPTGTEYGTALTSRLTHIADGVSDTDAANVRQLKESTIVDFDENYPTSDDHRLSTDFGYEDTITHGKDSTAYGYLANAAGANSVALGYQAYAGDENGVALGAGSVAVGNVVSVGHQKGDSYLYVDDQGQIQTGTYESELTRRITNVAEGVADYDIVNVAQTKEALKTAGIVKWDGVEGTSGDHYLATFFENTNYYTPGANSSAYGYLTKATGDNSVAFGYAAHALADNAVALGAESVANDNVISIGHAGQDLDKDGHEYGTELTRKIIHVADGTAATDLVNVRTMKLTDPVKTGTTDGGQWLATSETADVSYTPGKYAAAYGSGSRATGENAVTFGYGTNATAKNSVAIGAGSAASDENVVSVGHTTKDIDPTTITEGNPKGYYYESDLTRRIVNVAAGVADHDLVNVAQLRTATQEGGIVDYDTNYAAATGQHYLSTYFNATGVTQDANSAAFGFNAFATGQDSAALGYKADATAKNAIAVGNESVADEDNTLSVGHKKGDTYKLVAADGTVAYGAYTDDLTRVITGLDFGVEDTDAVSVAQLKFTDPVKTGTTAGVTTTNHYLTTLDPETNKPGENSVAYGLGTGQAKGAYASAKETVAFGLNATSVAQGSVALGSNSYAIEENVIALGHTTKQVDRTTGTLYTEELNRRIVNVADGVTDERNASYNNGTDLVNVRVLRENTKDAVGIVLTTGTDKNLYTELNDSGKVTSAVNASAYGKLSYAKNEGSVAIGYKSYAGVDNGIAIGAESVATEENTVSIGHKKGDINRYTDDTTGDLVETTYDTDLFRTLTGLAFGVDNTDAVSVAQLARWDPVKTGTTNNEGHWLATPMGGTEFARGLNSVAYGYGSAASGITSAAFGLNAGAYGKNSVAIGSDSIAGDANTVSFGHKKGELDPDRNPYGSDLSRKIIHVAAGEADTDLINKSQLDEEVDLIQVIDWDKDRESTGQKWLSTDFGKTDVTHGYGSTAYGNYANAQGEYSAALGYGAVATAENAVAIGRYAVASTAGTVSVGHLETDINPETGQAYGSALQQKITNVADGTDDYDLVNVKQLGFVDPVKTGTTNGEGHWLATTGLGEETKWTPGKDSVAYGFSAMALGENSTAFGALTRVSGSNSVALGALSATAEDDVVSIGHKSTDINAAGEEFGDTLNRRIVNVAQGENDTDLVTVAQLDLAAGTSGGVVEFGDYKTGGDYHLSTYITEDGQATNNKTSAAYGFQANVAATATNGAALGYGATVSVEDGIAIGSGSVADTEGTISFGDAANKIYRKITNAQAGIADEGAENYNDGTDAVTVGQLHEYYLAKSGTVDDGTENKWIATTYGMPTTDPGKNSASYGDGASAQGEGSVAYGYGATATHANSVALGAGSTTTADNTISVGDAASGLYRKITNAEDAQGAYDAVTLGQVEKMLETKGSGVVKFDTDWRNTGNHRLSIQFDEADPKDTTDPTQTGVDAVGFGYQANAYQDRSVAFGFGASVAVGAVDESGHAGVALGAGSVVNAGDGNVVSVGSAGSERKITNVRAGTASTDIVNVSQLNAVKSLLEANGITEDTNLGERVDKVSEGATTAKDILEKNGIKEVEEGGKTIIDRLEEAEKLTGNVSKGTEVDPSDPSKVKYKDNQTAIGDGSSVDGKNSSVYGYRDQVTGEDSTGMGTMNIVTGDKSTGTGSGNHIDGNQSSAYGFDNHVTGNDALAIGSGNEARGDGTVAIGKGAWATGTDGVSIGTGAKAVEGSVAIGAGSNATEKGTVSFGDGTTEGNRRLTNIAESEVESDVATYGSVKTLEDKTKGFDDRISNIEKATSEATFGNLDSLIDTSEEHIAKVGAGAAAIAALHPLEYDPSEKISFALGYGNYKGESAMALGAFVRPNESITISLGGSVGNGENIMNSSISFALGSGPSGLAARSKAALAKQVNEQDEKIASRDAEIAKLRSLISQLEAMAETEEQKTMAHQMVVRSESAELEELRSMAQQLVATASAAQLRSIVYQLSPTGGV